MSRSVILILPILALWFALASRRENVVRQGDKSREVGMGGTYLSRESLEAQRAGDPNSTPVGGQEALSLRPLLTGEGMERSQLIPVAEVGTPELVERIWQKIDPVLRARLTSEDEVGLRAFIGKLTSPEANDQPWICWGPDVPLAKVLAYHEAEMLTGMQRSGVSLFANQFLSSGRWNRTATDGLTINAQGLPLTLTWSIVPDGTISPGLNNAPSASSNLRSWLSGIYGGSSTGAAALQPWFEVISGAFDDLEQTCGVRFVYEPNDDGASLTSAPAGVLGTRGDIRLAARAVDGDGGTLAFAFSPDRGDMIIDSSDSIFDTTSSNSIRLHNTIAHELGHALGLDHVCPINQSKLMEPNLSIFFRGPRFDEFQSLQRLYGDALEVHSGVKNNDVSARATPLDVVPDELLDLPRLSIDDNSDLDYYQLTGLKWQKLSVTLTPGEGTYLEGPVTGESCSAGANFNSAAIHNLTLEILDGNGSSVLASSLSGGLGQGEQVDDFELPADGNYFIRVNGGNANAAQLYRMTVFLEDPLPSPRLRHLGRSVVGESGSVKNSRLDPGETIQVRVLLENEGEVAAIGLSAAITGSDNVTIFSSSFEASSIESGGESYLDVVFGGSGECGETVNLRIEVSDVSGSLLTFDEEFTLGFSEVLVPIDVNFDSQSALPVGWTTSTTGAGIPWGTSSVRSSSPLRSAFADNVSAVGEAILVSPSFVLGASGGNLTFEHSYRHENGYDGGVLEASRNGGAWFDLLESEATVISGGYDSAISSSYGSPIAGRPAWSGTRTSFLTTSIRFPEAWAGESLQLRWLLAHDASTSIEGWYLDNIHVTALSQDCEPHRPFLSLNATGNQLNENTPTAPTDLLVSSELPLISDLPFTIVRTGIAGLSDFEGSLSGVLPAGETSVSLPFFATIDHLTEDAETLILSLPANRDEFAPLAPASQTLTIIDSTPFTQWLVGYFPGWASPTGDSDGDGLSEIAEYLLGTDPTSSLSSKTISLEPSGDSFLIPLGTLPSRSDATLGVEFSADLESWMSGSFTAGGGGLLVNLAAGQRFLRLTFSLDQ